MRAAAYRAKWRKRRPSPLVSGAPTMPTRELSSTLNGFERRAPLEVRGPANHGPSMEYVASPPATAGPGTECAGPTAQAPLILRRRDVLASARLV